MYEDPQARLVLEETVAAWSAAGILGVLRQLISEVWRTNLDRHEVRLGDDARTLGMQSSRNICNLAVERLRSLDGVLARDINTLEVLFQGRALHTHKLLPGAGAGSIWSIDWTQSEIRWTCAEANTRAYLPVAGTLFAQDGPLSEQPADPNTLRNLHLAWQGQADGSTCAWAGFPRLGDVAWFAVVQLGDDHGGRGGSHVDETGPVPPTPDFDMLGEPDLPMTRRADRRPKTGQQDT